MSCERHAAALADLAAGGTASAGLGAHLGECEACRAALAELRAALAVADCVLGELAAAEPSPELRARIRQAAAEGEQAWGREGWPRRWALAAAAALVVVAVLALGWSRGWLDAGGRTAVAVQTTQPPASSTPSGAARPTTADVRGTQARRHWLRAGEGRAARVPRRTEPEVLVPPGEEQALRELVALAHRRNLVLPALAAAGEPSADLPAIADLVIQPLEIVPLDPAEAPGT